MTMRALIRTASVGALIWVAAALSACDPSYDGLDMDVASAPPTSARVNDHEIRITSGTAVIVTVEPQSGNSVEYDESDEVELYSENSEILDVLPGQSDGEFAIVGVWPGETELVVEVNGHDEDHIPFRCVAYE